MIKTSSTPALHRAKRLNVSEAKSNLSEVLREVADRPTIIHNRGRDVAVLVSIEDFERLASGSSSHAPTMRSFLQAVETLKGKHGGGVELKTERARLEMKNPLARLKS